MKSPGWDAFLAEDVDIVCLQEVRLPATVGASLKTVSGETLETVLHKHGFKHFIWHTAGVCLPEVLAPKQIALRICTAPAYAGVCVFSKIPPLDHTRGLGNEILDAEPRVLTVTFDHFTLVTAYAPSSGLNLTKLPRKRLWNSVFRSHVQRLCETQRPLIIAADFNATLTPDDDYFGPQHLTRSTFPSCSPEERQDMMALLQIGLVDTMSMTRHCGPRLTWAQTAADMNRNRGLRIDYVLVSQTWPQHPLLHTHQVDSPGSDHLPVRASFFETLLRESLQHQEDTLDSGALKKQYAPQKGVNRMHINPDTLEPGMLFIYPTEMSPGVTQTWFVAELLAFGEYDPHQEDRPLIYQHMGNYTRTSKPADPLGPYIRTWIRTRDRSTYHAPKKQREHDIAYTNVVSNDTLTSRQAVVYGFTLTDTHRVPLEVQRAVDASPWIDWKMPSRL